MILFNGIVEVLVLSYRSRLWQRRCLLQVLDSWGIRSVLIDIDHPWGLRVTRLQYLFEKAFRGFGIALSA